MTSLIADILLSGGECIPGRAQLLEIICKAAQKCVKRLVCKLRSEIIT